MMACSKSEPVFHFEAADTLELAGVVGDQGQAQCLCVCSDQQVVVANWLAGGLESGADIDICGIDRGFQRQYRDRLQHAFHSGPQLGRTLLRAAVAQLGRDDDAGADIFWPKLLDVFGNLAAWVPNGIADDVRVQQIAAQKMPSGETGASSMGGS